MQGFELVRDLAISTSSKIVLLVIDGLGGLPDPSTGQTELESAHTPNLDRLARTGNCGLTRPVGPGITPGSAPGHLGLFGYDPMAYVIGRGVLEALGVGFELEQGDVAARGNFCTVDTGGKITDRRAGRLSSDESTHLCEGLDGQEIDGVRLMVRPVKEHRCILVLRGSKLDARLSDTDPQQPGMTPLPTTALTPEAERTARVVNEFLRQTQIRLGNCHPANMLLLRGFSERPRLPGFNEVYRLKPAAVASYPMYRGLAKVLNMDVLSTGPTISDEINTVKQGYADHDFFFLHVKGADAAGEDGDFARKVAVIEEIDRLLPEITALSPDVLAVAGDHATPATIKGHSWHDVPCLISSRWCRPDGLAKFGETECLKGSLGIMSATALMPLVMAHGQKLTKYGA
ncbi:MAG: 2,3-bisphosphoglycerate-independent phosphoglycerate mutase [Dehalococcoidia bacterium]|nr:2,3-bisphosphoglycerate-independent phosphoglycerate mutase [Dehalococcoidia bacterium]